MDIPYTLHPGDHLKEWLEENKVLYKDACETLNWDMESLGTFLSGKMRTVESVAIDLERLTQVPRHFWINLDSSFQRTVGGKMLTRVYDKHLKDYSIINAFQGPNNTVYYLDEVNEVYRDRESRYEIEKGFDLYEYGPIFENDMVMYEKELHVIRFSEGSFCIMFFDLDEKEVWASPCDSLFNIPSSDITFAGNIRDYT